MQWVTSIDPSKQKSWYLDILQTLAFSTNMGLWLCYSKKYFECTFCPTSLFCENFNPNFVHHNFWPNLFQELRYILWFILINSISCGASQSTNVLIMWFFFLFGNGPFDYLMTKNIMKSPPSQVKIKKYILFHIATHICIKLYRYIFILYLLYFTRHKINIYNFTLTQNINKFHYEIYIYMECKS